MNYQKHYDALIQKAKSRLKPTGYTERHHILPKSLGGTNEKSNLVFLTAREHCFAHLLLAKIHGGLMWYAASFLTSKFKIKSRAYGAIKEKFSKECSKRNLGELNPIFGTSRSEETKQKIREGRKFVNKGQNHGRYLGPIEGTSLIDGNKIVMIGNRGIISAGFTVGGVYDCLGKRTKTHRKHTFKRLNKG